MLRNERMRIVLIAPSCDGEDVGEAWSSFQWASRISRLHDVTLLTSRKSYKKSVSLQLPQARVIEWSDLALFERWERFNSMLKPSYLNFYFRARKWLVNRFRSGERFDIAHQVSPLALRYPSPAVGLGIPLVIGPLGGSIEEPEGFRRELGRSPWYTKLRSLDPLRLRHDPWLRRTYSNAELILGVAPYVRNLLDSLPHKKVQFMSETGVIQLPPPAAEQRDPSQLRLLFVGRVIRPKGVRDAIRAIAKLTDVKNLMLDIVGDGNDLEACKTEARLLGVGHRVVFHGRLPRERVDAFYQKADVFVFPSFREPSGNAVIEAMSHGLAMIVADRGGPGFVVDDECGLRVPVLGPEQYASQIADCVRKLACDRRLVLKMGRAARHKIEKHFLWDAKTNKMIEFYLNVLSQRESVSFAA